MIIAVDAGCLGVTDDRLKVGVYQFALNLLENLSRLDKKNKYLLYSFEPIPKNILDRFDANWTNLILRPKKGWLSLRLSIEFLKNKPDIFLGLGQALPLYHPAQNIVFVYDLAFEFYPQFYRNSYKKLSKQTKFAVTNCDKIIAISRTTKNDLIRFYNIDPEKIYVVYPGVGIGFSTIGGVSDNVVPPSFTKPYFLFVGSYKPGKNIANIIKAFELFLEETKKPYELKLVGSNYWQDVANGNNKLNKRIKILNYVQEKELTRLYKEAVAFVSPSYYEGFGIPVLEAMAAGVPVIASNRGSIPEVTNDAALVVDPDDIGEMKNAMVKVATDEKLRIQMIKKGLLQAQKFSWKKSAKELLKLINRF